MRAARTVEHEGEELMKKKLTITLALILALSAALMGCAKGPGAEDTKLSGATNDILAAVFKSSGLDFMTFDEQVTEETSESFLGLTPEQMKENVDDAYVTTAAINVHAHLTALVKAKDAAAAQKVKELIAENFDSGRWICVFPEQSLVIDSGAYVLLVSSSKEEGDALKNAFVELAGEKSVGEENLFFTGL